MRELTLVEPHLALAHSHASLIADFRAHKEALVPWVLAEVGDSFALYLQWLDDQSAGIGLNDGFVPNSTFWLVEGAEILGVINIRHSLTPARHKPSSTTVARSTASRSCPNTVL